MRDHGATVQQPASDIAGIQNFSVSAICVGGTQSRKVLDKNTVREIREDIHDGNPIAPIVLFFDGISYWIGDGYHRLDAHVKEKRDVIHADVRPGTKDDALRFNIASNASADQTRWTNADKRNAVTLLLESHGDTEVTRTRAEGIMALAKCSRDTVYAIAKELRESSRNPTEPSTAAQPPAAKAVTPKPVAEDEHDQREPESPAAKPEPKKQVAAGARTVEMNERDEKIAALVAEGCNQAEISRRMGVSPSTISDSLRRQKLTPETANPLVKVLERAQQAAAEWEDIESMLGSGRGTAALWSTATREQKREVIRFVDKAIEFQTKFTKRLNKEAKE